MNKKVSATAKAVNSVKWSALMEIVSRTASPIIFVILARLLTPADFGIVATVMIAISFSQMFWDAGLSKALIQTNEQPEEAAHVVFWTNTFLGILIYVLLAALAPWLAEFFKCPEATPVLRVLGIQIVIASLSSVQQALFVRKMDFRFLFFVRLSTAFLPAFFSIPLAYFGYGVWALVAGSLAGQILNLILLWRFSLWRPKLWFDMVHFRKIFSFGIWVLAESFGGWLIMWGDSLIVGKYLGTHDLGLYRTGLMLVAIIFGIALNPFLPVLYPTFSRLQHDRIALKDSFHRVNRVVSSLALPMGMGLLLVGPGMSDLLFGAKWHGLGLVLSVLGVKEAINWLVGINVEIYRAMGRPDVNAKLLFIAILYYMPAYFIAVRSGMEAFVYVRLVVALVAIPLHVYLCRKMLGVSTFYLWHDGKNFFLATIVMGAVIGFVKWGIHGAAPAMPQLLAQAIIVIVGAGSYAAALWIVDRSFIMETLRLIRRAV